MTLFSWDAWNLAHIARHHVTREEVEYVVRNAERPFPREIGDDKYLVWGRTTDGRPLQVIFVYRTEDEIDLEALDLDVLAQLTEQKLVAVYVIHAMQLTPKMLRQFRRLRRRK
jgi:hypothetical protein